MSEEVSYPEQYPLIDKNGKHYRLLVNTNTDHWYFKILCGDLAVGEAAGVQNGDQLELKIFQIQRPPPAPAPAREGWLTNAWRKLAGDPPPAADFQGIGLGKALLQFIVERARDFLATEIVLNFHMAGLSAATSNVRWLQRRGFQHVLDADGLPSGIARLILVKESSVVAPPMIAVRPKQPQRNGRKNALVKKLPVSQSKRRAPGRKVETPATDFTKESLAKLFRPISDLINGAIEDATEVLDPAIRDRLKASNTFVRHGGDTRVLQYHIWDRAQPSIFHRHHFKFEVQHDPFGTMTCATGGGNFSVSFYMNKIRIYHDREEMVNRVRRELTRVRVSGFQLRESERSFCFYHNIKADTNDDLLKQVTKYLFPLLNSVHPMFYRIMDAYNIPMTKAERRAVITGRKRLSFVDRSSPNYGRNREFCREVPRPLRAATFQRDGHVCQHCERKFPLAKLHADHVLPVARGGLTTLGNLQTLCGPCNLKKGKRLEAELRKLPTGRPQLV